jgi:hypothetical protein
MWDAAPPVDCQWAELVTLPIARRSLLLQFSRGDIDRKNLGHTLSRTLTFDGDGSKLKLEILLNYTSLI